MAGISKVLFELVSIIMSILMSFGAITTPAADDIIKQINDDASLKFVLTGDPQVCNYNPSREMSLISLSEDIKQAEVELDAFIIAGDIVENGFQDEFDRITEDITGINAKHFIMAAGNHDIRLRDYEQSSQRILNFMNNLNDPIYAQQSLNYIYEINGYSFIVLSSDAHAFEKGKFGDATLQWFNLALKETTGKGKPVFVITHQPLAEGHGLPNAWGTSSNPAKDPLPEYKSAIYKENGDYDYTGSIGDSSNEIFDILTTYEDVFFITGHLHTGFGNYTYQTIDAEKNIQGINLPSVGIANKDGTYNNTGIGMYVEVTPSKVIFYARDFANGKYVNADQFDRAIAEFAY